MAWNSIPTQRETHGLEIMAFGRSGQEIASQPVLALDTVPDRVQSLLVKPERIRSPRR